MVVEVQAEHRVAVGSPDHAMPWGTRRDSSTNWRFNRKLLALYPPTKRLSVLDLGCAGGGFVRSLLDDGVFAVGLEGSDYSKRCCRADWRCVPGNLFTCDVAGLFLVTVGGEPARFDCVTSWELLEHLAEKDLVTLSENVSHHLAYGGMWVVSVSTREEVVGGVTLHQTVRSTAWWLSGMERLGWHNHPKMVRYFNTQFVRGPKQAAPGSFHLVLSRHRDGRELPVPPKESWKYRLYERWWVGTKLQKVLAGSL